MLNQQTLNRSVSYSGIGLHSGNRVNMTILPAPVNSGVRFRRVDLDGKPEIEARVENVVDTQRSTTIAKGNVKIHTVEHVLASLAGYGIDNAIIELDANEPPIADGSSREFCKIILEAGLASQSEPREYYTPTEPIEIRHGETVMTLFPDENFKITCTSADRKNRFTQFFPPRSIRRRGKRNFPTRGHFAFTRRSLSSSKTASSKAAASKTPSSSATTRC